MRATRPAERPTPSAAIAAAVVVALAVVVTLSMQVVMVAAQQVKIAPGTVVAAELDLGQVRTIDPGGRSTVLVKNLKKPNGVAILADGSVLIAESGANRVSGLDGRFGPELKTIVDLEFPQGLAVGLDGSVYVTLLLKGEVGRIDLVSGTYTKVAGDLKGPGDVAIREGVLYITEGAVNGGDVVAVNPADGTKAVVASGFEQPVGVAAGPGKILFVSDYKAGKVVKVDDAGKQTDFVKLDQPVQLAIEPYQPVADQPYALIVASKVGVSRYDANGKKVGATAPLQVATGVATVPASETPLTVTTTTIATVAPTTVVPTTLGAIAPTTRLRATTTTGVLVDANATTTSGNALTLSLLIIGGVAVVGVAFLIVRKPKNMSEAGFEERSLEAHSVAEAFGPCAAQEVEVAEAEGGLQSLVIQQESAEKRSADALERSGVAQARVAAATAAVQATEQAHIAAGGAPAPVSKSLQLDDLGLTTEGGRAALASFAKGEIDAHALEARWVEFGEQQAIDVVRETGGDEAPADDVPESVLTARTELAEAQEELETAEMDRDHAMFEIPRLQERLDVATTRITEARAALEACQAEHRAGVAKRVQESEATKDAIVDESAPAPGAVDANDSGDIGIGRSPERPEPSETTDLDDMSVRDAEVEVARQQAAALETRAVFEQAELESREALAKERAEVEALAKERAEVEALAKERAEVEAQVAALRAEAAAELEAQRAADEARLADEQAAVEAEREAAEARQKQAREVEAARLAQEAAEREAALAKAAQEAAEAKAAAAAEARAARVADQEQAARAAFDAQEAGADSTTRGRDGLASFDSALNAMFDSTLKDGAVPPGPTSSPDATLRLFGDADAGDTE